MGSNPRAPLQYSAPTCRSVRCGTDIRLSHPQPTTPAARAVKRAATGTGKPQDIRTPSLLSGTATEQWQSPRPQANHAPNLGRWTRRTRSSGRWDSKGAAGTPPPSEDVETDTTPGPNHVETRFIKALPAPVQWLLVHSYRAILSGAPPPVYWRKAHICRSPKVPGSAKLDDYQPIPLGKLDMKLLTGPVTRRIMEVLT